MPADDLGTSTRPPHDVHAHLKVSSLISVMFIFEVIDYCYSKLEIGSASSVEPNDKRVGKANYEGWCIQ